jgi:hypothetical protein
MQDDDDSAFLRPNDKIVPGESALCNMRGGSKSRQSSMSEAGILPGSISSITSMDSSQCGLCFVLHVLQIPCFLDVGTQPHMSEDSAQGLSLIRKEALRLVVHLSSSVSTKGTEQGLLMLVA